MALACVALSWLGAVSASAQISLDRYVPGVLPSDGFALARVLSPGHMHWSLQLSMEYANDPVMWETVLADDTAETYKLVSDQLVVQPGVALGLFDRVLVFAQLPVNAVVAGQQRARNVANIAYDEGGSLGNLRLGARVPIYGGRNDDPFSFGAQAAVGLPIADAFGAVGAFGGENQVTGHLQLLGDIGLGPLRLLAQAGIRLRDRVQVSNLDINSELTFAMGVLYPIVRNGSTKINAMVEMFGSSLLSSAFEREATPIEALTGLKMLFDSGMSLGVAGDAGLTAGYGAPQFRVVGMVGWTQTAAKASEDSDTDTFYAADECPKLAEAPDGSQDDDGCPALDNDADGVDDKHDACPTGAEDRDNFEDDDGCPDLDNDADGMPDAADECAAEAEDKDGFQDADGCPDPDNDGDALLDVSDMCPREAETKNGVEDDDGCPDLIRLDKASAQIYTLEPIRFEIRQTVIHPGSLDMLREVALVLQQHPEITAVSVEGHTDSKGNATQNEKLSAGRAAAVREFLITQGVAGERLTSQGFGARVPVADNATERGRARNRRVDFNITGMTD